MESQGTQTVVFGTHFCITYAINVCIYNPDFKAGSLVIYVHYSITER